MELLPIHERVVGLDMDIPRAQITACAIIEESGGETRVEQRQLHPRSRLIHDNQLA